MSIAFGSIGTGLPKDIVQQIIKAERIPIEKMNVQKSKVVDKQKLVSELSSLIKSSRELLRANTNPRDLKEFLVQTNNDLIDVTVDKTLAKPSSYQLEVVRLAQKSSAMTSGFADPKKTYTGVGFIQYSLPDGSVRDIYVDREHASLAGIATLINSDSEGGIQASVVNDGSGSDNPWRMILSLTETGDDKKAKFPYFYFVDGEQDLYLESEREAHDGIIKVDGLQIEVPGNTLKDVIPGVTIDLKRADEGSEFSLKIIEDKKDVAVKIKQIVESLNGIFSFINIQNDIDENTDTSRTLGGDMILQRIESSLRSAVFGIISTSDGKSRLSDIGVAFDRNGNLKLDEKKLESVISKNYKMVSELLVGYRSEEFGRVDGVLNKLLAVTNSFLSLPSGVVELRLRTLKSNLDQIDRRIDSNERRIKEKEEALKNKFARLEETISRIRTQGAGLAALGSPADDVVPQLG